MTWFIDTRGYWSDKLSACVIAFGLGYVILSEMDAVALPIAWGVIAAAAVFRAIRGDRRPQTAH